MRTSIITDRRYRWVNPYFRIRNHRIERVRRHRRRIKK